MGVKQSTISRVLCNIENFHFCIEPNLFSEIKDDAERKNAIAENNRLNANHQTDFTPPIYNIWRQQVEVPQKTTSNWIANFGENSSKDDFAIFRNIKPELYSLPVTKLHKMTPVYSLIVFT